MTLPELQKQVLQLPISDRTSFGAKAKLSSQSEKIPAKDTNTSQESSFHS